MKMDVVNELEGIRDGLDNLYIDSNTGTTGSAGGTLLSTSLSSTLPTNGREARKSNEYCYPIL